MVGLYTGMCKTVLKLRFDPLVEPGGGGGGVEQGGGVKNGIFSETT